MKLPDGNVFTKTNPEATFCGKKLKPFLEIRVTVNNKLCASHSSTVYFNHFNIFISIKKVSEMRHEKLLTESFTH